MTREDAIKVAYGIPVTKAQHEALQFLIPELAESEDERIRKDIIAFLQSMNGHCDPTQDWDLRNRWLPYLERQKEQKPNIEHIQRSWYMEGYNDRDFGKEPKWIIRTGEGGPRYEDNPRYGLPLTEDEKKQKPAEIDEYEIIKKHITEDVVSGEVNKRLKECGWYITYEKPTECSEDFTENIRVLLTDKLTWHSEDGSISSTVFIDDKTLKDIVTGIWFYVGKEALKYPNKEFNIAEWSEGDKEMIDYAYGLCYVAHETAHSAQDANKATKCMSWLKSLRPQPKCEWDEEYREEDVQTRFAFYTYKDDPSVLYLSNVFVEEASRNHGFGARILKAAEKAAEAIGATTIRLKVKQDSPANVWYRKNGYGYMTFEDGYDWLEKNLEYMKPTEQEWSEEDENMRKACIAFIGDDIFKKYEKSYECIAWLKNLRPQPRQEWSEEDEENFKWFDKFFRAESVVAGGRDIPQDKYLWFKSFRSRPKSSDNWKPSEEQIEWLESAVKLSTNKPHIHGIIISLYEQLKRL